MEISSWYLVIGLLLLLMGILGKRVSRLPLTAAMLYMVIGLVFEWLGWLQLSMVRNAALVERLSEIAVIVSLFSAGLKLRIPARSPLWRLPLLLALAGMTVTVAFIALAAMTLLDLPLAAAIILGAILAPTDPVLASDVKVESIRDTDTVRVALTGEAGLNDGTAFPFLLMGLALADPSSETWKPLHWLGVDVAWKLSGGLALGFVLGCALGHLVIHLRRTHHEAVGLDDFLALGAIAATYGLAHFIDVYGFVAVFAAGLGLRATERRMSGAAPPADVSAVAATEDELATHRRHAPAFMAHAMVRFNDQMEELGELAMVLLAGVLLATVQLSWQAVGFALLLFLVIRPLAVLPFCRYCGASPLQTGLICWFGVRGIGSVYYLAYAITHGIDAPLASTLTSLTLITIAASIALHGASGTPLMRWYAKSADRMGSSARPA